MSKDFEKLILEKLDLLNTKIDKLEENLEITNQKIDKLEENQKTINQKIDKLEENQKNTNQKVVNLEEKQTTNEQRFNNIEQKLNDLILEVKDSQEVILFNKNTLIKMEFDFNNKIQTLFDSWIVNKDEHNHYDSFLTDLNSKLFNHDIRISALENKNNPNNIVAED